MRLKITPTMRRKLTRLRNIIKGGWFHLIFSGSKAIETRQELLGEFDKEFPQIKEGLK